MSMRVGIDVRLAHWPGIGRYIEEIVGQMVHDHPETEFVLFGNAEGPATLRGYADPQLARRLRSPNVQFMSCGVRPFSLSEPFALARVVQTARVQVMHSPYINIPWLPRSLPLVVTLHDFRHPDLAVHWRSPRTWAKRAYYEAQIRLALSHGACLICVSHFLAGQLRAFRAGLDARIEVIPHAAGASFAPMPAGQAAQEVAARFGVKGPCLLFVGTLKPHKNLLAVIRALARPEVPADLNLLVAAAPDPRYPEVEAEIARLGLSSRVKLLGHLRKECLRTLYNAAYATLLPSSYESFGLPVVESMACGTPVIAAPLTSLPEVGGTAAWYADPSPEALAAAMRRAVLDLAEHAARRQAGLQQAASFSWQRAAASLHAVYRRLVGGQNDEHVHR
jgi:glycosyltransferase involved in cell wall biosynthesis